MAIQSKRWKSICLRIPANIYEYLRLMSSLYTNNDVSQYIRFLILKDYEKKSHLLEPGGD
jgi:hypothetical protein